MFALVSRMLWRRGAATIEDVAQDTFLQVFARLAAFDRRGGAAVDVDPDDRGAALDRELRRQRPAPTAEIEREAPNRADDGARSREIVTAIEAALAELSPELRAAFLLREYHDLEYAEMRALVDRSRHRQVTAVACAGCAARTASGGTSWLTSSTTNERGMLEAPLAADASAGGFRDRLSRRGSWVPRASSRPRSPGAGRLRRGRVHDLRPRSDKHEVLAVARPTRRRPLPFWPPMRVAGDRADRAGERSRLLFDAPLNQVSRSPLGRISTWCSKPARARQFTIRAATRRFGFRSARSAPIAASSRSTRVCILRSRVARGPRKRRRGARPWHVELSRDCDGSAVPSSDGHVRVIKETASVLTEEPAVNPIGVEAAPIASRIRATFQLSSSPCRQGTLHLARGGEGWRRSRATSTKVDGARREARGRDVHLLGRRSPYEGIAIDHYVRIRQRHRSTSTVRRMVRVRGLPRSRCVG